MVVFVIWLSVPAESKTNVSVSCFTGSWPGSRRKTQYRVCVPNGSLRNIGVPKCMGDLLLGHSFLDLPPRLPVSENLPQFDIGR